MEHPDATPVVSICGQIYNQAAMAKDMIQSVVDQTYQKWELIIVDDGSTDDLKSVMESFNDKRIHYLRFDENKGIPVGTNHALKQAQGKYICLAAADEVFDKGKLVNQVAFLDNNPKVDCVWGLPGNGDDNFPMGPRPEWEQYALGAHNRSKYAWIRTLVNLEGVPIGGCGLMMKKSVMEELGGLDESLKIFSDHELYCRFFEKYVGAIIPYRVAIDKPLAQNLNSVRAKNAQYAQKEHDYVKEKHPVITPPADGKVTVGIACYNYARYLKDCVDSLFAQTRPVDEILIVDDGSTDDFKTVVLQFTDPRIKVKAFPENMGMQEATTYLANIAEGDFFVSVAADDTLAPTYIEKCLAEFKANPWTEFVSTHTDFFIDYGDAKDEEKPLYEEAERKLKSIMRPVNRGTRHEWLRDLYAGNQYFGAGMYRTYAIREVGGWEKQYKVIADYQMYLKLLQRENIRIIEEDLTHTRVHGKNHSLMSTERHKELPWLYNAARSRFYRKHMKVIIATPFYELKGFSPYITSLMHTVRLLTALGIDWRFMELSGDSYVHRARNTMCDMFLQDPEATDLFFIDSDMSWNPEAFVQMCMLPDDVVGGAYPVKNNWLAWTSIPKLKEVEGMNHMQGRDLGDGTALIEAMVLAGGFLRLKRGVLERFKDHYKDLWYVEPTTRPDEPEHKFTAFFGAESIDHKFYGEDHTFSKRLRDMGVRMFIYPNVDIVHWGYKDFSGNYDKFLKNQIVINESALTRDTTPGQRLAA